MRLRFKTWSEFILLKLITSICFEMCVFIFYKKYSVSVYKKLSVKF